jgi:hypothetical protein
MAAATSRVDAAGRSSRTVAAWVSIGLYSPAEPAIVPEIGPDEHDGLPSERIADFPRGPRIGIGAVHDGHEGVGPVDPADVGREDAGTVLARLLLLGQEHLVSGGTKSAGHLGIPGAFRRGKQRAGEVQPHARQYRGCEPARPAGSA